MGLRDRTRAKWDEARRINAEEDLAQCRRQLRRAERWYDDVQDMEPEDRYDHDRMSAEERLLSSRLGRSSREDLR